MEKIYIYGNELSNGWGVSIGELIPLVSSLNDDYSIHDFVVNSVTLMDSNCKIVIDLDAIDPAIALTVALHIRLSVMDLKEKSFTPILLVSNLSLITFLSLGECSQFFLSQAGFAFCTPEHVQYDVKALEGLNANNFTTAFLNKIQISPDATVGRHSMANLWGADVLNRIISKDDFVESEEISKEKKKLYYKYVFLNTVPIEEIISGTSAKSFRRNEMCNALQKKVLLIDDEADKGWSFVLKRWLFGHATFDVVNAPISDFNDIPEGIRKRITSDYYDLYLLDLRLLGSQEDDIYDTDEFSGMKVLRYIKDSNIGNQVIIMTASNKAWNMKSLLDAGADGYYIKESPELKLPKSFSEANYKSFSLDVKQALNSGYKKEIYRKVKSIIRSIKGSTKIDGDLANEIISNISSAQHQLQIASSDKDFAYTFLTLFQVFELICRDYIKPDKNNTWIVNYDMPLYYYDTDGQIPIRQKVISEEHPSIKRKITSIYIDVCSGNNCKFIRESLFVDVDRRNAFVHNDTAKLLDPQITPIFRATGFTHLLSTIEEIIARIL